MADTGNHPHLLQLNGSTRVERHKSIALLRDAIDSGQGWITDFHEYSNLSICIGFEMPVAFLPALTASLLAAEVSLSFRTEQALQNAETMLVDDSVRCTFQVLFIHDEPDLRRTVLAVPG